jgi:hypothetical protein
MTQRRISLLARFLKLGVSVFFIRLWMAMAAMTAAVESSATEGSLESPTTLEGVSASTSSQQSQMNTGATPVLTAGSPRSSQSSRRLSFSTSLSLSSNLVESSNFDHSSSLDLEFSPAYTLNEQHSFLSTFSISKDLVDEQKLSLLNDASVVVNRQGKKFGKDFASAISLSMLLPLSVDSRKRDSLISSIRLNPSLNYQSGVGKFSYRLGFTRHIHRFTTATYGKSNAEWGLSNNLNYSTQLSKKLGASLSFAHSNAWTYEKKLFQSFSSSQEITYSLREEFAFSVGHTNRGSVLKDDGISSNIEIFNVESSTVYTSISYNF